MFKMIFQSLILCLFFSLASIAEIIKDVKIEGNKRISKESIMVFSEIKLGEDYDNDRLNDLFKNLYNTNFFKNIGLKLEKNVLLINVVENLIIEDIAFNGIKNKKLIEALTDIALLKSRSAYTEAALSNDVVNVKNLLQNSGYYFANVKTSLDTDVTNNTVRIIYNI